MRNTILASAIVAASLSLSVSASPYSDYYAFGDSLFDNGQFGVRFTNRVGPNYYTSEFGPVSPSLVAEGLKLTEGAPSNQEGTNYAVGDNRSLQTLQSVNAATTYEAPALGGTTFNSLFYDLDRTGRSLERKALYVLDGGGNDFLNFLILDEEDAGVAATNLVTAAKALQGRGAKYVVIANMPNLGLAPAGVPLAGFVTPLIESLNDQLRQQVASSNILIFDWFTMFNEVTANPAAYGIASTSETVSTSCFEGDENTCPDGDANARIDGSNPNPDAFLFDDGVHPTTIGQQLTADYMLSVLKAPGELSLLSEMGLDDMKAHWRGAQPVMRSNRWNSSTPVGGYTVWGGANGHENERDTDYNDTGTNEITQYNLGINYRFSETFYLGAMVSRADNELDFDTSDSNYEMESLDFSLLSGFRSDSWFFEGMLSYSDLDYDDLRREFDLGPLLKRTEKGDTNGEALGITVNAGYNLINADKSYRVGPMLGYDFVRVEVDKYTEKGETATALVVYGDTIYTDSWNIGLFGDIQLGFCDCELYSEAVYQTYGRDDSIDSRIGLVTQPGNSARLPGFERDDDGFRWDAGLSAKLTEAVELNVGGGILDTDSNDSVWFGGEVSYSF